MKKKLHKKIVQACAMPLLMGASTISYGQYCTPASDNGCSFYHDEVSSFVMNGTGGTAISDLNTGCSPGAYADNTGIAPVDLLPGSTDTAQVSTGYYVSSTNADYCTIWIDLNNDNVFEASEIVGVFNTPMAKNAFNNVLVNIPATAPIGEHRMRVTVYWFPSFGNPDILPQNISPCNTPADPLNEYTYGETQDYTVNIVSTPVPILLKSIAAKNVGSANEIKWSTSMENMGDYFELQHSTDGKKFSFMARVEGRQNASDYIYYDEKPVKEANYYRIKMTGRNGAHYSAVVEAKVSGSNTVKLEAYPNPTTKYLTVKAPVNETGTVILTDISGRVVYKEQMMTPEWNIDMSRYASGSYMLHFIGEHSNKVMKVNKQ